MSPELVVVIVIGAVTIVATLVAPRLSKTARIFLRVTDVTRLTSVHTDESIRLEAYHGDERITDHIFIVSISIENTGSKDITESDFVDPIMISAGTDAEIISASCNESEVSAPSAGVDDGRAQIRWKILKPSSKIELKLAVTAEDASSEKLVKQIDPILRLRDVLEGPGLRSYAPVVFGFMLSVTIAALLLGFGAFQNTTHYSLVYAEPPSGKQQAIRIANDPLPPDTNLMICVIQRDFWALSSCKPTTAAAVAPFVHKSQLEIVNTGLSPLLVILAILLAGIYGLAIPNFPRFLNRFRAMFDALR